MTSLASLAYVAATPPPAFNGLFYATVATVIPVLFLAVAVQGRIYESLVNAARASVRRQAEAATWLRRAIATIASLALFLIASTILLYGVLSEVAAVVALYQQRDGIFGPSVLFGVILMAIAAAGPPALVFWRYPQAPGRELASVPRMREQARHVADPDSAEPGATTLPETGETDTEG